jgi:CheY-like chemotaxis protein
VTTQWHGAPLSEPSDANASISIPTADADESVSPTPAMDLPRRRILVTDDNQDYAASLAMLLEVLGHEVRTAHGGLEAVAIAAEFRPDVILLDIGMPEVDGYEAYRRIRAQPWSHGILMLALTGWGQDQDKLKARAAGFDDHLVKPVQPAVLEKLLADFGKRGG